MKIETYMVGKKVGYSVTIKGINSTESLVFSWVEAFESPHRTKTDSACLQLWKLPEGDKEGSLEDIWVLKNPDKEAKKEELCGKQDLKT